MNKVKYCPKCGTQIETDERFCGECGFDTQTPNHPSEVVQEPQETSPSAAFSKAENNAPHYNNPISVTGEKKSSNTAMIVVIALLGSIFIIGGLLFWWFSANHNNNGKSGISSNETTQSAKATLDSPSYSLNEGSYTGEQTVTINKPSGTDVKVYYTIDGSNPTTQSSLYENPLVIKSNTTLKSIAIDKNNNQSTVKSAVYTITAAQAATTQTSPQTTTPASSEAADRAQFESNINGAWARRETSGFVLYYVFNNGNLIVTDGGSDYFNSPYSFSTVSGTNGTVGTVTAGTHTISIDCNPMGDNAIYIDGILSPYSP